MRVVILQSNYVPWKGYFDLIHDADLFVFYDEVKYTKNDWRNRNRIYTKNGLQWLTIPIPHSAVHQAISEVLLPANDWRETHLKSLSAYGKAPYYTELEELMKLALAEGRFTRLSELNQHLIRSISDRLGIKTRIVDSSELRASRPDDRGERLLVLLKEAGATEYISGPSAREYLAPFESRFKELGIALRYKDYSSYPTYSQLREPFEHAVSILDLVANAGWERSPDLIWGPR